MVVTFVVDGDLDAKSIAATNYGFEEAAAARGGLIIDLSRVRRIDGAGLGALVYMMKRKRAAGQSFVLANASGEVAEILKRLGMPLAAETAAETPAPAPRNLVDAIEPTPGAAKR